MRKQARGTMYLINSGVGIWIQIFSDHLQGEFLTLKSVLKVFEQGGDTMCWVGGVGPMELGKETVMLQGE